MDNKTREKIAKVYQLVQRGVDGEQKAAKIALDRLLKKHNVEGVHIHNIIAKDYQFKYATRLDLLLFQQLKCYFLPDLENIVYVNTYKVREIVIQLEYLDYVVLSTAYAYFKSHMREQFKMHCSHLIKRCRSTKTRNKRRKELQDLFFNQYIIASKLYKSDEIESISYHQLSDKERKDRDRLAGIQGGKYHTQMTTGLRLNQ